MSAKSELIHDLVASVEIEYGSVENAPYDDPRFEIPRKIYQQDRRPAGNKSPLDTKLVMDLWERGFTDDDITDYVEMNQGIETSLSAVRHLRSKFGKPNKSVWLLTRGMQKTIISTNNELADFLRFKTHGVNKEQLIERAKQDGWIITRIVSHDY